MTTCPEFRPDHNGECLNCDEWRDAHTPEAIAAGKVRSGANCWWCHEPLALTDDVVALNGGNDAIHRECLVRQVVGSVAHQQHRCLCYGGTDEDAPEMSRRESALAAFRYWLTTPPAVQRLARYIGILDEWAKAKDVPVTLPRNPGEILTWARNAVAQGAGHDCSEWLNGEGTCAVCGRQNFGGDGDPT